MFIITNGALTDVYLNNKIASYPEQLTRMSTASLVVSVSGQCVSLANPALCIHKAILYPGRNFVDRVIKEFLTAFTDKLKLTHVHFLQTAKILTVELEVIYTFTIAQSA
jgi:hypothetical protein